MDFFFKYNIIAANSAFRIYFWVHFKLWPVRGTQTAAERCGRCPHRPLSAMPCENYIYTDMLPTSELILWHLQKQHYWAFYHLAL